MCGFRFFLCGEVIDPNCFTTNFFSSSTNFFPDFFSLTHFQLRNGLAFSLYQQVQIIFLWYYDREWNSLSIDVLNIYIFLFFGTDFDQLKYGIFWDLSQNKNFNLTTLENLLKKKNCGKTEKICVLTIKNLWYNSKTPTRMQ